MTRAEVGTNPIQRAVREDDTHKIKALSEVVDWFRKEIGGHPLITEIRLAITADRGGFDEQDRSFVITPTVRAYTTRQLTPEEREALPSMAFVDEEREVGLPVEYVVAEPEEDRVWHSFDKEDVVRD